ncbi:response regulator [Saliniramus sp.]|uniref:response regulator n=1 Tax=Saliniramus sp. TaxID=2986772 RepID=UPI002C4F9683|nr:response regulator [Saliniramus sp.]HMB10228.1 response regulator [Saliniramus sp.]
MLLGRSEQGFIYVFEEPVRILAVDDDPIMREMATAQLSHPGGEIVTAENGQEAWDILAADPGFDLVLSDLEMPQMTGFALCTAIREDARLARLPVVVLTGREDMFAIDRAYEVGATSFATKPVNWRMLGYQLRYVLRNSRDNEAALAAVQQEQRAGGVEGGAEILRMPAREAARAEAPVGPDPITCLRILLDQPPEKIAGIVAQCALSGDASDDTGAILRRYADLIAARRAREAAAMCGATEQASPPVPLEARVDDTAHEHAGGVAPSAQDDPASGAVVGDPVAAMRAQLRQSGSGRPDPKPARPFRFLASGGRT